MPALNSEVCTVLLEVMALFPVNIVIQAVCIAKLALKVCWVSDIVLGLRISEGDAGALNAADQALRMLEAVRLVLAKFP